MRVEQFCILLPTSHFELLPSPDSGLCMTGHQAQHMNLPQLSWGDGCYLFSLGQEGKEGKYF